MKDEKEPLVSVIIPTFNGARFILDALNSVFNQTYTNYEIIVIDDGSADNTSTLLTPHLDKIKYIYKENGGISSARNLGIKISKGQLVAFLDVDDIWRSDKLDLQVTSFYRNPEIGLCYTGKKFIDENSAELKRTQNWDYPEGWIFDKMLLHNYITTPSLVMCPLKVLVDVGMFDPAFEIGQDYDLWLRISYKYRVIYIDAPLVYYRYHSGGISRQTRKLYLDNIKIVSKIASLYGYDNNDIKMLSKKRYLYLNKEYAKHFFFINDAHYARKALLKLIYNTPFDLKIWLRLLLTCFGNHGLALSRATYQRITRLFKGRENR